MKIRTDFVTNSSSSSFILAFNNKNTIEETLRNEEVLRLQDVNGRFIERILDDVFQEDNRISTEEAVRYASEEFYHNYKWRERCFFIDDVDEYNQAIEKVNKQTEDSVKELEELLKDKEYVTCIEYGDDDGRFFGELEHEIVPKLDCCICSFSHH